MKSIIEILQWLNEPVLWPRWSISVLIFFAFVETCALALLGAYIWIAGRSEEETNHD